MVWGVGSESIKKKKKRHPLLTAFFIVSQGFFPLCLFPCLQEILRKTQQGGVRGAEEVQGLGERAGDQSQLHFINICFHSASLRGASPARTGQDDGVVSQELRVEGTTCLVRGGVLNA